MHDPARRRTTDPTWCLVRELATEGGERRTLDSVARHAVELVPGCRWAGVTLRRGNRLQPLASTDEVAADVDRLQHELREGPCIDAVLAEGESRSDDTATETRWPRWAPRAHRCGVRAALGVRLSADGRALGGLNLYGDEEGAFDHDAVDIARAYADTAAAVICVSRRLQGLETALGTRHTIGVAQGIVRQRHGLSVEEAFQVLVRVSRHHNLRLRDLAAEVVADNRLPQRYVDRRPR